jgi:SecD/SecF fusion protein
VAADANVVIFERIKEEVRLGKTVRAAISSGYTKGFRTIIDANVVTLITAGVLFMAGTGSVKGFAFTLAVGVLVSMFTAVLATRAMLAVLSGFRWFNNAALMGASGQKVRWRADITGRKYLWFVISGVVVLIAAGSLVTRGLNLGIDFKGGTAIETTFVKPATQDQVINVLAKVNDNL